MKMHSPTGPQATLSPSSKKPLPVAPKLPSLSGMPETLEELFRSVALTVSATVDQPDPAGKKSPRKQEYSRPWAGYTSWRDARARLEHFEATFKGDLAWMPFNDSTANDGPMSLNAYPGRAFIERVTNEGDANLEAKALHHDGVMPTSPTLAAANWFGLTPGALSTGLSDDELRALARRTVTVTAFVGDPEDHKNSIFDARDYGIGLTAAEMPGTILSLNRGNKKTKLWLTGKHGQGASSTYQYSDLTLIASRKVGSATVAFTFVEGRWDSDTAKTPTYRYLTVGGKVPEIEVAEIEFPAGTLVRHVGYTANELFSPFGEHSLYGLLMRSLAEPIFPVWLEMFSLRPAKVQGYPAFRGFRRYGRLIRGTVNVLERAWQNTLQNTMNAEQSDDENGAADESGRTKILHRNSEYYQLPQWDYGGRTGIGELGKVKMTWWVADPAGRRSQDVVRNWVDPDKIILMTLDGQTHAEESRAIVTGQHGAKLWAVGRYMVVQIDCNELDPKAKYEMFTSTREHAKETPIKKMILAELVRRLGFDKKLEDLNVQLAAADIKQTEDKEDTISSLIKKYLKAAGISFDQLVRKVEKWIDVEEDQDVPGGGVRRPPRPELPPIEAVEPPTFVRWKFSGTSVRLYPGQRYSFLFETDAPASYWDPADQNNSKIKVLAHGVSYVGAGEMKGGRVRCHFECPSNATVGAKGYVQVQLDFTTGAAKTHRLPVDIVEKPKPRPYTPPTDDAGKGDGDGKGDGANKTIKVKVRKKDFSEVEIPIVKPIPVKREDPAWATLGWPHDPGRVGFSIRSVSGKVHLYYNVEFPPFLDLRHKMSKKSLADEFVHRYELKLVLHTIFTLNYDFVDEEEFAEEQKKRFRNLLCATAESLALATKSELEIESKLKSEDSAPLETAVAANLEDAAAAAKQDGAGVETSMVPAK
jgi:hypothetical protein